VNAWKSLVALLRNYKHLVFWNIFFTVWTVIFSLFSLIMIIPFLQLLFDKTPMVESPPVMQWSADYLKEYFYYIISYQIKCYGKGAALAMFCGIVAVVFFLKNLFRYLASYFLAPLRNGLIYDIRDQLYQKLLKLPVSFFHSERKGELITKMTTDVSEIEYSIINTLEASIQAPLTIILYLVYMFVTSFQLTLFVFGMIIVMALFVGRIGKSLKRESKEGKEVAGRLTSIIEETISGIKIIKGFLVQPWILEKFTKENQQYYHAFNKMYRKRDLSSPLTEFLAIVIVCMVLWFGGHMVLSSHGSLLTAESFIGFMVIFSQLIAPAKSFSTAYYDIQKGKASYERIQEILHQAEDVDVLDADQEMVPFDRSIEFKEVSYRYQNSHEWALQDFSFQFEKGKKYALVGPSGAGKSTLFDLFFRFSTPVQGQIQIDETDIQSFSLKAYRQLFGIVPQEPILFNYSVAENIGFGHVDPAMLEDSLKIANAYDFVQKMIYAEATEVGERGGKLSGGERQRLSISRVAYHNPEIILLDEATSALDTQNEREVQTALNNLLKDKTSILIAHRLSTVRDADCILVMKEGRLMEFGSHTSLMDQKGLYFDMVQMQSIQ